MVEGSEETMQRGSVEPALALFCSLVQPGRLQSDGNVSLVWVSEKLHLRVSQAVLPGVELLLRPQPPQKSLNVLHPKLEEVAAIMVAEEESAPREEAASPQEDSAESCTGMHAVNISSGSYGHR